MTIKIEAGKLYMTRDGRKAFCSVYSHDRLGYHYVCLIEGYEEVFSYQEHGRLIHDMEQSLDIVAEWSDWKPINEYKPEYGAVLVDGVRTGQNSYAESPFAVAYLKDGIWTLSGLVGVMMNP